MTNLIYTQTEASILFGDSAQTPDAQITLANLSSKAGQVSAQYDLTAAPRPERFWWQAVFQFATAPVIGQSVDLYVATAQETAATVDGGQGQADAALGSSDELRNLLNIGQVVVTSATASHDMIASGMLILPSRYVSLVVYNNTDDGLRNDTGVNNFTLTPIPPEVQ